MQIIRNPDSEAINTIRLSLEGNKTNWKAVHIRTNSLRNTYKDQDSENLDFNNENSACLNIVNELMRQYHGWTILSPNFGILLIGHEIADKAVKKMTFQLRYLFSDDSAIYNERENNAKFIEEYDVQNDYSYIVAILKNISLREKYKEGDSTTQPAINLINLINLEDKIYKADISVAYRRQSIYMLNNDVTPFNKQILMSDDDITKTLSHASEKKAEDKYRKIFDELFISIAHLKDMMNVRHDLTADADLFRYLTKILDKKLLSILQKNPNRFFRPPVSVNINIDSILSEEFDIFDNNAEKEHKNQVIFEISAADIFNNSEKFSKAKTKLQRLGYGICADGLSNFAFVQISRKKLGFNLIKLQWREEMSQIQLSDADPLTVSMQEHNKTRVVLCHCDSQEAIDFGQKLGINMFQGRHLDALMGSSAQLTD